MSLSVADTAYSIARVRADERTLFEDPFAKIFADAGAHAEEGTARFLALPFFVDGIRLRTRAIDDHVRERVAAGVKHVVLLGAGFDARALRMPELANAVVYEVDFAEQLAKKRALLAAAGVTVPPSIVDVPCDFNADFESVLRARLPHDEPLVFVWEGVIGYISEDVIDRTLRLMASVGGKGTTAIFNFANMALDGAAHAKAAGFTSFEDIGFDEFWRRHLTGEPPPQASFVRIGIARK